MLVDGGRDGAGRPPPVPPWRGRDIVLAGVLGVVVGIVAGGFLLVPVAAAGVDLDPTAMGAVVAIAIYGSLFLWGWLLALERRGASLEQAGFTGVGFGVVVKMALFTIVVLLVNAVMVYVTTLLIGDVPTAGEILLEDDAQPLSGAAMVALVLAAVVAAPLAEEFFFRGLVFRYLRARFSVIFSAVTSSILFALIHLTPILLLPLFVMGVVFAWLAERYQSIYPPLIVHALNNGAVLAVVFATAG